MNILYINHYAGSLTMGMEFRPYYLAREWKKLGHKVRIVGADFSHLRKENPAVSRDFEIQTIDGIEYQWIKTNTYQGNGVKRAITMFQFCSKLYFHAKRVIKEFSPDVVISSSTYPLDTYPAQKIARLAKAKYIHEGHDLWPLTLTELMGMSKLNPFIMLMAMAEKSSYKNADHVVSVLPFSWKHMLKHGLKNKEKFTHIPNGIVVEDWENSEPAPYEHTKLLTELKNNGKKIICYLGGHALSNALDTFIYAATKLSNNEQFVFVLIGSGDQKQKLIEKSKEATNIYFLPSASKKAVPTVLKMADILYIGAKKCKLYKFGVSMNKVYDYMMASKPILYAVDAPNNMIDDYDCGISIEAESAEALVDGIKKLLAMDKQKLEQMGENGKKAVIENFNYTVLAKKFIQTVETI